MSPLDTSFLHIEDSDRAVSLHIGSIGIFEGPPPAHEVLARTMEQRLAQVPRCRQRVEAVPFGLERPVWVDDDDFSVDYHLRRTALPQPAGRDELRRLVGRLMSQRLDRTKPLWEMWVVEGLADGTWALVSKVHHCMVDGVSGAEILAVLLDMTPDPPEVEVPPWVPDPAPSRRDMVLDAARALAFDNYERLRLFGAQLRRPGRAVQQAIELLPGLVALGGVAAAPSSAGLTGPISPHREYAWADASLDDVKQIRSHLGGTVNDVVLAAVSGGFRHLLLARGEDVPVDRVVRTLVPVSVRSTRSDGAAAHDGSFDNRISAMFAELPVGVVDPAERLAAITAQLAGLKESGQAVAGEVLTALSGFAPPALLSLGMRVAARAVRGSGTVHTVTTNVPGPQLPLYSCGRRLLRAYPYVPIAAPLRTGVAIFSYDGAVTFGVTGDREVSRDVDVLAHGIELAMQELLSAATSPPAAPEAPPVDAPESPAVVAAESPAVVAAESPAVAVPEVPAAAAVPDVPDVPVDAAPEAPAVAVPEVPAAAVDPEAPAPAPAPTPAAKAGAARSPAAKKVIRAKKASAAPRAAPAAKVQPAGTARAAAKAAPAAGAKKVAKVAPAAEAKKVAKVAPAAEAKGKVAKAAPAAEAKEAAEVAKAAPAAGAKNLGKDSKAAPAAKARKAAKDSKAAPAAKATKAAEVAKAAPAAKVSKAAPAAEARKAAKGSKAAPAAKAKKAAKVAKGSKAAKVSKAARSTGRGASPDGGTGRR